MASRGFLIRFIDIGLIVLFGFIMISDIEQSSQIELAADAASGAPAEPGARDFIAVDIDPAGAFAVAAPPEGAPMVRGLTRPSDLTEVLRTLRAAHAAAGRTTVVLIRPHEDSAVQRTVDVMDVCDRLGLAKSLQMQADAP